MAEDNPVRVAVQDGVATITIDRPKTLNALSLGVLAELEDAVRTLGSRADVKVIVFTGAGERAFVAGGDIADLESRRGLAHYQEFAENIHRTFRAIETLDVPTISAVRGYALGGGVELLLATDIRILSDTARLGLPEITIGLFPGAGGSQRLPRQVPLCVAKYMMFTGEQISAQDAVRIGLANEVVPDDQLEARVAAVAATIAAKSKIVLKLLKRSIVDGLEMSLEVALRHEQAMSGLTLDTDDAHEGCQAFLEKRPPNFADR
jgi:enoyl-CoA hydratase